jgi:hypothetical protein
MVGILSACGETKNTFKILVTIPEEKNPFERCLSMVRKTLLEKWGVQELTELNGRLL